MLRVFAFVPLLIFVSLVATAAPPNIVVFVADDVTWGDIGAMGHPVVKTPNLDALAEGGLLCTRAFLTTPQCSPSRISVLTGKYPHATGAEDLHMPMPDTERILPDYLRERGYFSGHMQKTHYGPHADAQFDWYSRNLAEAFPEFLDGAGEQPFFLWVGFRDAHRPYAPNAISEPHEPDDVLVPPYLADTRETREDLALYYDEISRMDGVIGEMVGLLQERKLFENTIVIFFTDNGMPFPRAKGTLYDSGIGTPLIAAWPAGGVPQGVKFDGLVSLIDLAPTLLEAAGDTRPVTELGMQGRSMLEAWRDPSTPGRQYVFSERNWHNCDEHMRSLRTEKYKLIRNAYLDLPHGSPADVSMSPSFKALLAGKEEGALSPAQAMLFRAPRPRIELYDVQADPWETENLMETAEGIAIARELEAVLNAWGEMTGDFSPEYRRRGDNTDRFTGEKFMGDILPQTHPLPDGKASAPTRR